MFITVEICHHSLWKRSILLAFPGFLHASPQTFGPGVVSLQHQKLSVSLSAVNLVHFVWYFLFIFFFQTFWRNFACIQGKKELETMSLVIWIAHGRSDKESGQSLTLWAHLLLAWFIIVVKVIVLLFRPVHELHCRTIDSKHTVHANEWLSSPNSCALFIQINQAFYTMLCSEESMTSSLDIFEWWWWLVWNYEFSKSWSYRGFFFFLFFFE